MLRVQNSAAVHDVVINEQNKQNTAVGRHQEQAHHNFSECLECTQVDKKAQNVEILPRLERYNHGKQCSLTSTCNENRCTHTKRLRGQDFIFCKT